MSYFLTEEQQAIRDVARRFTKEVVAPRVMEQYGPQSDAFIREMGRKMADLGFHRIHVPEHVGGLGLPRTTLLLVYEEIAKESASLSLHLMLNSVLPMVLLPVPAMKEKWFERMLNGEAIVAGSSTDPQGNANFTEWKDMAVRDGDDFVLNGSKNYCTGALGADLIIFYGLHKGTTWAFPVETGTPGMFIREDRAMGLTTFGAITLSDVRVPVAHCLEMSGWVKDGELQQGEGLSSLSVLDISSMSLGLAEGVFEKALAFAHERTNAGKPILSLGAIQVKFAKMKGRIEAIRNLIYNAARLRDEGRPEKLIENMIKPMADEMAAEVTRECTLIFGGSGYCVDTGIERYVRDAFGLSIGECTADMHWSTVSTLMGMPGARLGSF